MNSFKASEILPTVDAKVEYFNLLTIFKESGSVYMTKDIKVAILYSRPSHYRDCDIVG